MNYQQTPIEELDTDMLLELILQGYDVGHLQQLPGMPVIRDLVVDQSLFFKQYERVMPWLINDTPDPAMETIGDIKTMLLREQV